MKSPKQSKQGTPPVLPSLGTTTTTPNRRPTLINLPSSPMDEDDAYGEVVLSDEDLESYIMSTTTTQEEQQFDTNNEQQQPQPRGWVSKLSSAATRRMHSKNSSQLDDDDDEEDAQDADDERELQKQQQQQQHRPGILKSPRIQQQRRQRAVSADGGLVLEEPHTRHKRSNSAGKHQALFRSSAEDNNNKHHPPHILRYIRSLTSGGSQTTSTPRAGNKKLVAVENIKDDDHDDDEEEEELDEVEEELDEEEGDNEHDESSSLDSLQQDDFVESDMEWEPKSNQLAVMPLMPNHFCNTLSPLSAPLLLTNDGVGSSNHSTHNTSSNSSTPYLETAMWTAPMTTHRADSFVWEHSLLLQAVLQLLAERDQVGVEGSVDVADNIWKKGPLKKMSFAMGRRSKRPSAGTWKVKYVEVRRGNLCYYEDSGPSSGRKTIHLRQAEAVVQESSAYRGPGFVFELLVQGSPTRYWLARSEEERQTWIKVIQSAMIGELNNRYRDLDLTPHQPSIQAFTRLRAAVEEADLQDMYVEAVEAAAKEVDSLELPVEWILEQIKQQESDYCSKTNTPRWTGRQNPAHRQLKNSITEFWNSMSRVSFSINGFGIPNDSSLAAQRVVGSLTRCFLEFDKAVLAAEDPEFTSTGSSQFEITELQAVSYARSILDSVLRSRERKELETVVKHLLSGRPELVCVSARTSDENELESVTRLDVSFPGEDLPDDFDELGTEDISRWVWFTRRKNSSGPIPSSRWKRRYAVLSGTVLSLYEGASPRPHGLRGQVVLAKDTTISTREVESSKDSSKADSNDRGRFVVRMSVRSTEYILSFSEESDMTEWRSTLLQNIESIEAVSDQQRDSAPTEKTAPAKKLVKGAERVIKGAADGGIRGGIRVIRGAKDSGMKAMKIATDGSMKVLRGAVGRLRSTSNNKSGASPANDRRSFMKRSPSVQLLLDQSAATGKREPTVQCIVQRARMFTVRSPKISGETNDEEDEPWMSVQATYYHAFLMSGGPSGKLNSGDALVAIDFLDFKPEDDLDEEYVGEIEVL